MLSATSTEWAPWYVIPADRKWFARIGVAAVLIDTLMRIDPSFPVVDEAKLKALAQTRLELEAQAPEGAAPDPAAVEIAAEKKKAKKAAKKAARKAKKAATKAARKAAKKAKKAATKAAKSETKPASR